MNLSPVLLGGEASVSPKSSAQALHWLILCEDSWFQPPFRLCGWTRPGHCTGSPHHSLGGLSISQGMDEDAPKCVCKRGWKEGGSQSTTSKDGGWNHGINSQIFSQPTAMPCSSELRPPVVSDRLEEFSC